MVAIWEKGQPPDPLDILFSPLSAPYKIVRFLQSPRSRIEYFIRLVIAETRSQFT